MEDNSDTSSSKKDGMQLDPEYFVKDKIKTEPMMDFTSAKYFDGAVKSEVQDIFESSSLSGSSSEELEEIYSPKTATLCYHVGGSRLTSFLAQLVGGPDHIVRELVVQTLLGIAGLDTSTKSSLGNLGLMLWETVVIPKAEFLTSSDAGVSLISERPTPLAKDQEIVGFPELLSDEWIID
ncbi:unnamed protein product [Timema podura]|uniref:Uncharacterized protein n=1 Tax=Timema podura TaxID=61482 RepID=A0ABN7NHH4_TIMPD|nr:unnamed protein product [Timema podura]